jgi:CheY-like chemotaxis protein
MLGATSAGLRAWEERYGVVVPTRSAGGHRLYSRDQVEQLRYLQNLMDSGLHAAEAHRVLAGRIADRSGLRPARRPANVDAVLILVAERDLYAAEFIDYLLRTEGFAVVIALNATDTIEVFEARHPDLVFVELVVSARSGLELCRQLTALGATVVAVSALAISPDAIDAGAAAFLLKPLDPLQVLSTVKDLLGLNVGARRSMPSPA